MMQAVAEIEGVAGAHVMAYRQESLVAEIVKESGVIKDRKPWMREPNPGEQAVADRMKELNTDP
jgi:hypothetical protein